MTKNNIKDNITNGTLEYVLNNNYLKRNIKKGTLNNGLKYVLNNDDTFKSCSVFIFVRVGSKHEKKEEYGMAHFLEHILFKGTKKYRTNLELNRKIDSLSATTNASTGKNFTCYFLKLPSINTEEGIELLKEMVFFSILNNTELEKEKDVVIEEMNKSFDDSEEFIEDLLPSHIFKGTNLEHYIIGERDIINNMERKDIMKFYKKYYIPSNCTLVISGNFDKNLEIKLPKLLNFEIPGNSVKNSNSVNHNYELCCYSKKMRVISDYRENYQITLGVAFPLFNYYDKRKYCLEILIAYLDGFLTSKLWLELREKNPLVYDTDASYELFEEGGIFQIVYSLEKRNVYKSLELVYKILEQLKKKKIKEEEFKMFQKNVIFNLDLQREDTSEICHFYGEQYLFNEDNVLTYEEVKKEYMKCTTDDIYDLVKFIDYNKMVVIQMGDMNKKTFEKKVKKIFI